MNRIGLLGKKKRKMNVTIEKCIKKQQSTWNELNNNKKKKKKKSEEKFRTHFPHPHMSYYDESLLFSLLASVNNKDTSLLFSTGRIKQIIIIIINEFEFRCRTRSDWLSKVKVSVHCVGKNSQFFLKFELNFFFFLNNYYLKTKKRDCEMNAAHVGDDQTRDWGRSTQWPGDLYLSGSDVDQSGSR